MRDVYICVGLYFLRMFCVTAGYHRYFAHRSYKMGRTMQFLIAFGGGTSGQKGALWWASIHHHHHKYSDQDEDPHNSRKGFWWSHVLWILCEKNRQTRWQYVNDWKKFPELVWLNKWHMVPPILLGGAVFLYAGWSGLVVGFFLSTVLLWHGTFTINSFMHMLGKPRYKTGEDSKNSPILFLLTMGENWHNNHHYYQSCVRQGFYRWEIDITFRLLQLLSIPGLVWGIRYPPVRAYDKGSEDRVNPVVPSSA